MNSKIFNYNWIEIQNEHNNGLLLKDIIKRYDVTPWIINKAVSLNLFKKVKHIIKHSEKTKKILSEKRKKWLKNNPDKHPWKDNKKFISKPCEELKKILKNNNINFDEEITPLKDRQYSIDIALIDKGIGLEVNGNQHYNDDKTLKVYYQERKEKIEKKGWKLYDIHYTKVYNKEFVNNLIKYINNQSDNLDLDFEFYRKKIYKCVDCDNEITRGCKRCIKCHNISRRTENYQKNLKYNKKEYKIKYVKISFCKCGNLKSLKSKLCKECYDIKQRKVKNRPSKEILLKDIENIGYSSTGKKYGVSDNTIRKWLKMAV